MRHPAVPLHLKIIAAALALLIISPLNILGDIPFLGLFDDVALLGLLAGWFVGMAAHYADAVTIEAELVTAELVTTVDGRGQLRYTMPVARR